MLEDASPADMKFLVMDCLDPPKHRHVGPKDEDVFCQKLLLLGAKWWDSMARYLLLNREVGVVELDDSDEPEPTKRERYWVSVAWPTSGGFLVSEFDTNMWGDPSKDDDDFAPDDIERLRLCVSMEEKAQMLGARFKGTAYSSVEGYRGNAFIRCWEVKEEGEVGPFQETWSSG